MTPISNPSNFLSALQDRVVLADGAMGTMIYSKGVFINTCFESLNLTRGHLVKSIHLEYIQAGAEVLETNTFGAHQLKLARHGLGDKVREINLAAVQLAREAAQGKCWIAGTVGPLGEEAEGSIAEDSARKLYAEQIEALVEGGVDLLLLETFSHLPTLSLAVKTAKAIAPDIAVVALVHMADPNGTRFGDSPEAIGRAFDALPADVVGLNDGPGVNVLVKALETIRPLTSKPLALLPGTGQAVRHDDQTLHLATPEYFMELLRRGIQHGARLVGGSCGSNPEHIRAIKSSIRMLNPGEAATASSAIEVRENAPPTTVKRHTAQTLSRMAAKLRAGEFVVSVEIDPPVGTDATSSLERAAECAAAGVDCINIADGPRASARMGPVDMAMLLRQQVPGIEPIVHFCCRDRNILGMQADLIGANALGIHNILMITGDPPKLGDYPFATAVYDVDAIGALSIGHHLNNGEDLAGNPLKGDATRIHLGCGANPGAIDLDNEIARLAKKIEAGAEYIMTQPVYEFELFKRFHERAGGFGVPILIGILPLASYRNAEFLHNEVPGMQVPLAIRERMKACPDRDSARETGIEIAREALTEAMPYVQGVYVMPPFNRVDLALSVIEVAKDRIAADKAKSGAG
jgi:methionine synthase I (cobalamin-dependent)/5,10-methylenetetrahydrofolate reductase